MVLLHVKLSEFSLSGYLITYSDFSVTMNILYKTEYYSITISSFLLGISFFQTYNERWPGCTFSQIMIQKYEIEILSEAKNAVL